MKKILKNKRGEYNHLADILQAQVDRDKQLAETKALAEKLNLPFSEDSLIRSLRDGVNSTATDVLSGKISEQYKADIAKALEYIKNIIPTQGRVVYGLMPKDVKSELDKLTNYIISNNPKFQELYEDIFTQRKLLNEMLHSSDTNYGKYQLATYTGKLNDEINRTVGNAILKAIIQQKKSEQSAAYKASHRQASTDNLLNTIMGILTARHNSGDNALKDTAAKVFGNGDLSKEQIAELIYQMSDKQNTAEM